jgi:threonine dehydrogenase-like Zn-dependent dehydrogenase
MSEMMLSAAFKGDRKLVLENRPVPNVAGPNDVLLAVKGVGVCGTDLHILEVPPRHPATENVIMGHEFCGEVIKIGSQVTNCAPGVPGFRNTPGIFHDGALAKYIVVPDYMVYQVAAHVPWHHMAVTETVACAFNALRKAKPEMGETAVVLGGRAGWTVARVHAQK